jgi:nicotinate phosphoribosyltransferase
MARQGQRLLGVRLDSGDMTALSKAVRAILDSAGLPQVQIVASGGFDEYAIAQALQDGACIDQFGVGTRMGVAADAPYYDMADKLVQYDGRPVMKLSADKATLVEAKQIWRRLSAGQYVEDLLALRHEAVVLPEAQPLLHCVMRAGQVVEPRATLAAARALHASDIARLPAAYRRVQGGEQYAVRLSAGLAARQQQVEAALRQQAEAAREGA